LRRALEQREEVAHRGGLADRGAEVCALGDREIDRRLDVERERRATGLEGRRLRDDDVVHAERAEPRAVAAPDVAHVNARGLERDAEMLARDGVVA